MRHRAGAATYPGDQSSAVGRILGPTTFGSFVIVDGATHDPATNTSRVEFVTADPDDEFRVDEFGTRWLVSGW